MSLIVYATENPLVSLGSIMLTITLVKDIYNYMVSPYVIANTISFFHRFYSDTLYISDFIKELTLPHYNTTNPLVNVVFNIVSLQISSFLYLTEFALYTMIKTSIFIYQTSMYIMTTTQETYNTVQLYLADTPAAYSLDYWMTTQKEYPFDFNKLYNPAVSFLAACTLFVVYKWVAKKMMRNNVQPVQLEEVPMKPVVKERRRSPRLAMLYLTDHNLSRKS